MDERFSGIVDWFDAKRSYGFITVEGKSDLFVYYADIAMKGFKTLKKGQVVTFAIGLNKSGKPKAIDVLVVSDGETK